jgi:hypothetical protein
MAMIGAFRIFLFLLLVPIMAFINVYRRLIIRVETSGA